jgi:hypothetical protein
MTTGGIQHSFVRFPAILVAILIGVSPAVPESGRLDPAFSKIPFDEWLARGDQSSFKWSLRVNNVELSSHQRLRAEIEVRIDGAELAQRRGKGQLEVYVEISDVDNVRYQDHGSMDLEKLDANVRSNYVTYTQPVFIVPGEYRLGVALLNTATGEHHAGHLKFRIPPLKNDPLPNLWAGLPAVEFIPAETGPDAWYLPSVKGRLHFEIAQPKSVLVDVLVNVPMPSPYDSRRTRRAGMGPLIATMKAISQMNARGITVNVELLDLARRRVTFRQNVAHPIDWSRMRDSLAEANPGTIDVKALENRHHNAQFFVAEVARKVPARGAEHVVIVLTAPMAFESGEDLHPIQVTSAANCRLFYFRFRAPARPAPVGLPPPMRARRGRPGMGMRPAIEQQFDQLEQTLKPLNPRLFDVENAGQVRRAFAAVVDEIGRR